MTTEALYTAHLNPTDYARPAVERVHQASELCMRDSLRHFVAEFVGTFALVFIGGGAIMSAELVKNPAGITQIALAHGLILALMVTATMRVSGHLNPAVTLGFLVTRRIEPVMAMVYLIAQILARSEERRVGKECRSRWSP